MSADWQPVSRGLRLILTGAKTVGWSIGATFLVCGLGYCLLLVSRGDAWPVVLLPLLAALAGIFIGRLLCTIGRFLCCRTPDDARAPRATIRLAVIFETCGLLGWPTTYLFLVFVYADVWIVFCGFGFAALCNVAGRVFFFHYLHLIGLHVQSLSLIDEARRFFRFSVLALVTATVGTALVVVGNTIRSDDEFVRAAQAMLCIGGGLSFFVSAGLMLYLTLAYFVLIAEAQRTVASYTPPPAENDDDPDREYRERYLAGGGTGTEDEP